MTGSHLVLILGGRYERNCDIDAAFALKCLIRIGNKTGQRERACLGGVCFMFILIACQNVIKIYMYKQTGKSVIENLSVICYHVHYLHN